MPAPRSQHSGSVAPDLDESLISYILHWAPRRRLTDARVLATKCGPNHLTNRLEPAWLNSVAVGAGIDDVELDAASPDLPHKLFGRFRKQSKP
jgi:hypothetical protein